MRLLCALAVLLLAPPTSAVTMDWTFVGDPGNACDVQAQGCFGAVDYRYRVGKYEVTNAQYAEFLNAVAATDTNALYNASMGSGSGGITRSGSAGSFTYTAIAGRASMPVNYVSFYDGLRFTNWLNNGQLTGAQNNTTTEDGAYTFSGTTMVSARNAGAEIFLTSEDEWYKAAYYDPISTNYFDYPSGTDTPTVCALPGSTPNTANCYPAVEDVTVVGSYTRSVSPYGTFDQAGNVMEWIEAMVGPGRGLRGGAFPFNLASSGRFYADPAAEYGYVGFRIAMVPEPGTGLLLTTGLLGLASGRQRRVF